MQLLAHQMRNTCAIVGRWDAAVELPCVPDPAAEQLHVLAQPHAPEELSLCVGSSCSQSWHMGSGWQVKLDCGQIQHVGQTNV